MEYFTYNRMANARGNDEPGQDQQQTCDLGGRTFFMEKKNSCNKPQGQTQLPERLNETDVCHILHGKENKGIGSGTAYTCNNRIDHLLAHELSESLPFGAVKKNKGNLPQGQPHLDQKEISQRGRA